ALVKSFGTPALFITLNPSDVNHPLLAAMGGLDADEWRTMTAYRRAVFVAQNPAVAARFFETMISNFLTIVVKPNQSRPGLF
ncbi:hypothetical protein BJ138DRAFT_975358, partial [Hygrophoropsis aurantiaca]